MFAICDLAETVFCDTHAVESVFAKDFFQFFTSFAIEFRICIVVRIIDEWKRNNVETWIKCRVDQVGVHGDLNRVPIHQSLNTFGLVAVCKLVSCINIDFNLSACSFFHQFTELTSAVSPGTCLSSGASEVPGCFRPVQITVIFHCIEGILCEKVNQILGIVIALALQFVYKPVIDTVNCFFEGVDVHVFFLCDCYTVLACPAFFDLVISGAVDVTLIFNCFLSCLVNNFLLLWCETVVDVFVDTEEQAVINCIPHRAVRLNLLNTCSVDSGKRILLTFYCVLLKCCVSFRPVHVCGISAPSLVAFHQKVGACYTNLQVLHIVYRFNLMFAVCDFAETVLCNTHAVESVLTEDFFQLCTCFAIEFRICIVVRIIDERKRNNVETWIKCRVDQVGVHGDLNRVPIHQSLNTFGLVAVCKLVSSVNVDFDFAACGFFHQFTELTSAISPCTCLSSGACEVPGHFRPVKVAVICDCVKGVIAVSCLLGSCVRGSGGLITCVGAFFCKSFRKESGGDRDVCNDQKNCNAGCDHWHNCP